MDDIEKYIEMLYEDSDRLDALTYIRECSFSYTTLQDYLKNEVLMGALTRLFREESKNNFELATNTAIIFRNASQFSQFGLVLSHYKVGGIAMQLIDYELKRGEMWRKQSAGPRVNEHSRRKIEFAIRKQQKLVTVCLETLINLANELEIELKMVRRGIVPLLAKCFEMAATPPSSALLIASCRFLWKLSAVADNHTAMGAVDIVTKCARIVVDGALSNAGREAEDAIFALLFNLSFDSTLCRLLADSGFINALASRLDGSSVALNLLYQISVLEEVRAMIAFTDVIPRLKQLLTDNQEPYRLRLAKALMANVALERRNAQLISATCGAGLDEIVGPALVTHDPLALKIVGNVISHDSSLQAMILKWMPRLTELAMSNLRQSQAAVYSPSQPIDADPWLAGYECLRIISHVAATDWPALDQQYGIIDFIRDRLADSDGDDEDIQLQAIILAATVSHSLITARKVAILADRLVSILEAKFADSEYALQILRVFAQLLTHNELAGRLCVADSGFTDQLIRLCYSDESRLQQFSDQTLRTVLVVNPNLSERVAEERFRRHNTCWLEMAAAVASPTSKTNILRPHDLFDHEFSHLILDADDVLEVGSC